MSAVKIWWSDNLEETSPLMLTHIRVLLNQLIYYAGDPKRVRHGWQTLWQRGLSWWLNAQHQRYYSAHDISGNLLAQRRSSDTIFIFGAGMSLHDVSSAEWEHVAKHNTLGWHLFSHQEFVRADFYLFRETHATAYHERIAEIQKHIDITANNPCFANTLWIVQRGWFAINSNILVGYKMLPRSTPILRFYNSVRGDDALPTERFSDGIAHGQGTLTDAINLAYVGGWRRIVLIGIDLYDTRYFVHPPWEDDEAWLAQNPSHKTQLHPTAQRGIIDHMRKWTAWLGARDVEIFVYNPKSLLNEVMPVYDWRSFDG